jgi:hypothetical protein
VREPSHGARQRAGQNEEPYGDVNVPFLLEGKARQLPVGLEPEAREAGAQAEPR